MASFALVVIDMEKVLLVAEEEEADLTVGRVGLMVAIVTLPKNGGGGGYPTHSNPSGPPVTCRPMNCSNVSVSYREGYRRYLDSSPP